MEGKKMEGSGYRTTHAHRYREEAITKARKKHMHREKTKIQQK